MSEIVTNAPLPWSEQTERLFDVDLTRDFNIDDFHISARVIADSVNKVNNKRITTLEIRVPRHILAEVNTHRVRSANFQSSRACPTSKIRSTILNHMFVPIYWGQQQSGMSAEVQLSGFRLKVANLLWKAGGYLVCGLHKALELTGVHKQTCNRIVEPWMSITGIITCTEWDNLFQLRYSKHAQPEFIALTKAIHDAIVASKPVLLENNEIHLPYIFDDDRATLSVEDQIKVSVARCCRVSYNNIFGAKGNTDKDIALYNRLLTDRHMSPFEHIAFVPCVGRVSKEDHRCFQRNFDGWYQYRAFVDNDRGQRFFRSKYERNLKRANS